jgi:hypothetical protein
MGMTGAVSEIARLSIPFPSLHDFRRSLVHENYYYDLTEDFNLKSPFCRLCPLLLSPSSSLSLRSSKVAILASAA